VSYEPPRREPERDPALESVLLNIQRTGETGNSAMRAVAIQRGLAYYEPTYDLLCLTNAGRRLLKDGGLA
jgi:hypothetical protein